MTLTTYFSHWDRPNNYKSKVHNINYSSGNRKIQQVTHVMYSLIVRWISLAALSWRFHILVEETISSSLRVGNCFLNLMSICSCSFRKSSDSSTCPRTCLTSACRMSRQWILLPFAIGRLKLTNATILGLEIPNGGSRLAMKSLNCEKFMNCVACGSYLRINHRLPRV